MTAFLHSFLSRSLDLFHFNWRMYAPKLRLKESNRAVQFKIWWQNQMTKSVQFKCVNKNQILSKGQCQNLIDFNQILIKFAQFWVINNRFWPIFDKNSTKFWLKMLINSLQMVQIHQICPNQLKKSMDFDQFWLISNNFWLYSNIFEYNNRFSIKSRFE